MTENRGRGHEAQHANSPNRPVSNRLQQLKSKHGQQEARDKYIGKSILGGGILAVLIMFIVWVFETLELEKLAFSWLWFIIPTTVVVVTWIVLDLRESDRKAAYEQQEIDERIEQEAAAAEVDKHFASGLRLNRSLLKRYHDLSTEQAHASFRLAHYVMIATATILIGGTVAALVAPSPTASVTIGALAGLTSALSGYISSTLITSYRVAVQQAQVYFREPLAGGYLLSAERLASNLPEKDQSQATQQVINGLVQAAVGVAQNAPGTAPDNAGRPAEIGSPQAPPTGST